MSGRLLILGGTGMLGHQLWAQARERDAFVTVRGSVPPGPADLFRDDRVIEGVDAYDVASAETALDRVSPKVVVNCIGLVKQLPEGKLPVPTLMINALFPQRLAELCRARHIRLIHVSTDCVFSGNAGPYTEQSSPDADDFYGRTKLLGEVAAPGCLTLRTSIIGRELRSAHALVDWFLLQAGRQVQGYRHALFTGLTTVELSRAILRVVDDFPALEGLYQVASDPVSKFDLLHLLARHYGTSVTIEPADEPRIDRRLDGTRFRTATGYVAPSWDTMIAELAGARHWRQA
ncbi:MAG TPA: SDR family oxidoreductase [Luteitalea sp.]|nr:SDR family oxidoreductase [Luteitalea sp.]